MQKFFLLDDNRIIMYLFGISIFLLVIIFFNYLRCIMLEKKYLRLYSGGRGKYQARDKLIVERINSIRSSISQNKAKIVKIEKRDKLKEDPLLQELRRNIPVKGAVKKGFLWNRKYKAEELYFYETKARSYEWEYAINWKDDIIFPTIKMIALTGALLLDAILLYFCIIFKIWTAKWFVLCGILLSAFVLGIFVFLMFEKVYIGVIAFCQIVILEGGIFTVIKHIQDILEIIKNESFIEATLVILIYVSFICLIMMETKKIIEGHSVKKEIHKQIEKLSFEKLDKEKSEILDNKFAETQDLLDALEKNLCEIDKGLNSEEMTLGERRVAVLLFYLIEKIVFGDLVRYRDGNYAVDYERMAQSGKEYYIFLKNISK